MDDSLVFYGLSTTAKAGAGLVEPKNASHLLIEEK